MDIMEDIKEKNEEMLVKREEEIEKVLNGEKILKTSGTGFDGYEIMEYLGMICEEIIIPNGLLGLISHGTFYTIDSLAEARQLSIEKLEDRARAMGANGIVGIDLDIQVFPSIGAVVSVNGTAVCVGISTQTISMITKRIEQDIEKKRESEDKLLKMITEVNDLTADDLIKVYRKSGDKKAVIYNLVIASAGPVSAVEIRGRFADEVDLLEIAAFLNALEKDGKLKKDVESKKYSKI